MKSNLITRKHPIVPNLMTGLVFRLKSLSNLFVFLFGYLGFLFWLISSQAHASTRVDLDKIPFHCLIQNQTQKFNLMYCGIEASPVLFSPINILEPGLIRDLPWSDYPNTFQIPSRRLPAMEGGIESPFFIPLFKEEGHPFIKPFIIEPTGPIPQLLKTSFRAQVFSLLSFESEPPTQIGGLLDGLTIPFEFDPVIRGACAFVDGSHWNRTLNSGLKRNKNNNEAMYRSVAYSSKQQQISPNLTYENRKKHGKK